MSGTTKEIIEFLSQIEKLDEEIARAREAVQVAEQELKRAEDKYNLAKQFPLKLMASKREMLNQLQELATQEQDLAIKNILDESIELLGLNKDTIKPFLSHYPEGKIGDLIRFYASSTRNHAGVTTVETIRRSLEPFELSLETSLDGWVSANKFVQQGKEK